MPSEYLQFKELFYTAKLFESSTYHDEFPPNGDGGFLGTIGRPLKKHSQPYR
jgi:hypothetical protein